MPKAIEFLAEQLKTRRKKAGMSQDEFADKTGISLTLIRDIERKKANPTLSTIEKIADFFQVSIAELLDADDVLNNPEYIKKDIFEDIKDLSLKQLRIVRSLIQLASKE